MYGSLSKRCEPYRAWIEAQVELGRNAQAIYQDLVEQFDFTHRYNSVKRFVRTLKVRDPERFDVLESLPGEEAQVDFGLGALALTGNRKYRRQHLFVMPSRRCQVGIFRWPQVAAGAVKTSNFRGG